MKQYTYSDYLEKKVLKEVEYLGHKYIWNETDLLYYREDTEELALTLDFVESRYN